MMLTETNVKCKACGHTWESGAKLENIAAGKVSCKKCGKKDLVLAQPPLMGEGTPEALAKAETEATGDDGRPKPRTGGEVDDERKEVSLRLAKAKAKLEKANAEKRASDLQEYLETELTDDEVKELVGLEKRANCGNPHPPLFPEDMKRLANLRLRLENSSRTDI